MIIVVFTKKASNLTQAPQQGRRQTHLRWSEGPRNLASDCPSRKILTILFSPFQIMGHHDRKFKNKLTWMSESELQSNTSESGGRFSVTLNEILVVLSQLHEPSRDSTPVVLISFINCWAWCFQVRVLFTCKAGRVMLVKATSPCKYPVILG